MNFISENIRTARVNSGMRPETLASKAKVSSVTLRKYENGQTFPTVLVLIRLAEALGKDILFFFSDSSRELGMNTQDSPPEDSPGTTGATIPGVVEG